MKYNRDITQHPPNQTFAPELPDLRPHLMKPDGGGGIATPASINATRPQATSEGQDGTRAGNEFIPQLVGGIVGIKHAATRIDHVL